MLKKKIYISTLGHKVRVNKVRIKMRIKKITNFIKNNINVILTSFLLLVTLKLTSKILLVNLNLIWVFPLFCGVYGVILRMTLGSLKCDEPLNRFNALIIGLICLLISAFFVSLDFNIYIDGFMTLCYLTWAVPMGMGMDTSTRDLSNIDLTKFFNESESESSESEWENQYNIPWRGGGSHHNLPLRPGKCPVGTPERFRFIYRDPNKSPAQVAEEWKAAADVEISTLNEKKMETLAEVQWATQQSRALQAHAQANEPYLNETQKNQLERRIDAAIRDEWIAEQNHSDIVNQIERKITQKRQLSQWVHRRSNAPLWDA